MKQEKCMFKLIKYTLTSVLLVLIAKCSLCDMIKFFGSVLHADE